mgnify:CR=1 FL=1|tara:strand:- start:24 stop:476 length:453 start_codon:yes stop_codon:yes gene_type:complete
MGGGGSRTHYSTTKVPNDYDDAWIRDRFGQVDQRGLEFSNWMAGRQATLGSEADQRTKNRDQLAALGQQFAVSQEQIRNLQAGTKALTSDFAGLSGTQLQQAKDLFNLAQTPDSGVTGVRTNQGLTFTKPRTAGTGTLNRNQLTTGSLNV